MSDQLPDQPRVPLQMRGHRFKPLTWEAMTPAQVQMVDNVLAGQRGSMQGPYNVLLRSPALGDLAQRFGAHTRFHSSLPLRLNELAILLVARFWRCEFVWWAHRQIAIDSGLPAALVDSILAEQPPGDLPVEEAAVFGFCHELIQTRRVNDATYAALVAQFGEAGAVDLMGTMSYYTLVSMSLNVDQYPLPPGATMSFERTRTANLTVSGA
jgi:4-carboxymuconolactone decarboxylase